MFDQQPEGMREKLRGAGECCDETQAGSESQLTEMDRRGYGDAGMGFGGLVLSPGPSGADNPAHDTSLGPATVDHYGQLSPRTPSLQD